MSDAATRELVIKIKGDQTDLKRAVQEAKAGASEIDKAAKNSAATAIAEAKLSAAERTKIQNGLVEAHTKATRTMKGELESVGQAGAGAFMSIGSAAAAANAVLGKGIDLARAYKDAAVDAARKSRELASGFGDYRDQLRDLASMMGVKGDNAFALANAKFNVEAAMRPQEGLAFRSAFQGSGAQFSGKSMTEAEFNQFEKQAAQLAAARGLAPEVGGELAGSLLGMKNFTGFGDKASETALAHANQALAVLGRGRGDNSVLAGQLSRFAAAAVNEDALKGSIQNPIEAAAMISTAAESAPTQAAELSTMALRGLRDFKNPLIGAAKITPNTPPIEALTMLSAVVEAEAKKTAVKPEDVLRSKFSDVGTAEAIGVFLNKGVSGGVFKDRLDYAKGFADPASAMGTIADFQRSDAGASRIADAKIKEAEAMRGAETSRVEILRREATAKLIREKKINTTATNLTDYLSQRATFGLLGSDERTRINSAVEQMLSERADAAGVGEPTKNRGRQAVRSAGRHDSAESTEAYFNSRIDAIQQAGGNPFAETNTLLRQQNDMMKRDAGGVPPALPAAPAPAMKRP